MSVYIGLYYGDTSNINHTLSEFMEICGAGLGLNVQGLGV